MSAVLKKGAELVPQNKNSGLSGSKTWLVSMTDMIAILLAFFVFLYTQTTRREETKVATTNVVERTPVQIRERNYEQRTTDRVKLREDLSPQYLAEVFRVNFRRSPLLGQAILTETDAWVVISLPSALLFPPASARINPAAEESLLELATVLTNLPNEVIIIGHANPLPIRTDLYPSNWHLSLARAEEVRRILERSGYVESIRTYGRSYGDYEKLYADLPDEEKLRLAKRVDVIVFAESPQ